MRIYNTTPSVIMRRCTFGASVGPRAVYHQHRPEIIVHFDRHPIPSQIDPFVKALLPAMPIDERGVQFDFDFCARVI